MLCIAAAISYWLSVRSLINERKAAIPNLNPNAAKTTSQNSIQTLCFVALDQRLQRLQGVSEVRELSMIFHRLGV